MGCDIHLYIEKKQKSGTWALVDTVEREDQGDGTTYLSVDYQKSFFNSRSYNTFSMLADVRNGYGVVPIAQPRGLPAGCSEEYSKLVEQWGCDGHSHSYLSVRELLDYDWTQVVTTRGFLTLKEFERWTRRDRENGEEPKIWCSAVTGRKIPQEEAKMRIDSMNTQPPHAFDAYMNVYVECAWTVPYYQTASTFVGKTLPRLLALCEGDYDSVRCVFFFDN